MPLSTTKTAVGSQLNMKNNAKNKNKNVPMLNHPMMKFHNVRLDPERALRPARKKLTSVEAERVMSVFKDTIRRVAVVTALPYIMDNVERFRVPFGADLVDLITHHSVVVSSYDEIRQELEKRMERVVALKKTVQCDAETENEVVTEDKEKEEISTDIDNEEKEIDRTSEHASETGHNTEGSVDSQLEAASRNLGLVALELSHSVRNILRAIFLNPAIVTFITEEVSEISAECKTLLYYLRELREILLHKLLTTPEEEQERVAYLREICKRERQNSIVIVKLEADLKEKDDDKSREIQKKNDIIRRFQTELHQIEKLSEDKIRRMRTDAEKQEAADERSSENICQKMRSELGHLRTQLQNDITEHRDREQDLRRKKYKVETEVESWILKYDDELGQRQDQFEEIDAIYTEEKKQLQELEERFKIMETEYFAILAKRQLAREQREKKQQEHATMVKSAATIQSAWRSYRVRKMLHQRKKKKRAPPKK